MPFIHPNPGNKHEPKVPQSRTRPPRTVLIQPFILFGSRIQVAVNTVDSRSLGSQLASKNMTKEHYCTRTISQRSTAQRSAVCSRRGPSQRFCRQVQACRSGREALAERAGLLQWPRFSSRLTPRALLPPSRSSINSVSNVKPPSRAFK